MKPIYKRGTVCSFPTSPSTIPFPFNWPVKFYTHSMMQDLLIWNASTTLYLVNTNLILDYFNHIIMTSSFPTGRSCSDKGGLLQLPFNQAGNYMFKVNNRNTRKGVKYIQN